MFAFVQWFSCNAIYYFISGMQRNGRLTIRLNNRKNPQRNSFVPSESQPSNEFDNSEEVSQSEEDPSQNSSYHAPPPPPLPPKKQPTKELKQSLFQPPPIKNSQKNVQDIPPVQEEKKQDNRKMQQQKRRNNFNSFEATNNPQPQAKPAPPPPPPPLALNNNQNLSKIAQKPSPAPLKESSIQQKKVIDINKNIQKLSSSINDLRGNYDDLAKKEQELTQRKLKKRHELSPFGVKMSPQKEQEIKEFLTIKQKEKKQRRKKVEDYYEREKHRLNLQSREQEMLKERERKRRLKQLKSLSKFDDKHERWKQQYQEKQKQAEQFIKKYENEVKFHIKKQQEDKQKEKKRLQKERELLKQRKDFYKSIEPAEIEQHQKWYQDKLYQLHRQKQDAKEEEAQRIAEENASFNQLWRGQSHGFVEEEIIQKKKKKREPREKARRIREYKQYVKKNFIPKTYQSKTIEPREINNNDSRLSHREVKRYRYYKGVAYGEVIQTLPQVKDHHEQKKIGDNYMQFMKSLPKKRQQTPQEELMLDPEEIQILERKFNSIGKVKRQVHSLYDEHRRKKTSVEVPVNPNREDLKMIALQLKAHDEKLKQKQILLNYQMHGKVDAVHGQQKAINQGLVENIERKLSLLAQI